MVIKWQTSGASALPHDGDVTGAHIDTDLGGIGEPRVLLDVHSMAELSPSIAFRSSSSDQTLARIPARATRHLRKRCPSGVQARRPRPRVAVAIGTTAASEEATRCMDPYHQSN